MEFRLDSLLPRPPQVRHLMELQQRHKEPVAMYTYFLTSFLFVVIYYPQSSIKPTLLDFTVGQREKCYEASTKGDREDQASQCKLLYLSEQSRR